MRPFGLFPPEGRPPAAVTALMEQVERDGGHVLALYREPVGDRWQALLPAAHRQGGADSLPARPLPHSCQALAGGSAEDRPRLLETAIRGFDVGKVRYEDVQRSSVFAAPAGD